MIRVFQVVIITCCQFLTFCNFHFSVLLVHGSKDFWDPVNINKHPFFIIIICWSIAAIQINGPLIFVLFNLTQVNNFLEFVPYDKPFSCLIGRYSTKVNKCLLKGYRIKGLVWIIRHWYQVTDCSVTSISIQNDLFSCPKLMMIKSKIKCQPIHCEAYLISCFQKETCLYNQLH